MSPWLNKIKDKIPSRIASLILKNRQKLILGCLVAVLLLNVFFKFIYFDDTFTFHGGESARDYLIASHVARGEQFLLLGPDNAGGQSFLKNSPVYFYILSLFLLVKNDFLFLVFASIALWLVTVVFVYLLARRAFGAPQALIAALLFSFIPIFWQRSSFIWQPYIMMPFINLSYVFMLFAHLKKSFPLLLAGLGTAVLAGAVHNPAFASLAIIALIALFLMKKWRKQIRHYCGALIVVVTSALILYSPVFAYLAAHDNLLNFLENLAGNNTGGGIQSLITHSLSDFFNKFSGEALKLIHHFASLPFTENVVFFNIRNALALFVLIATAIYFFSKRAGEKKIYIFFILLAIIWQLTLVSLLKIGGGYQYTAPIFGILAIAISEIAYSTIRKNKIIAMGIFALFAGIFFPLFFKAPQDTINLAQNHSELRINRSIIGNAASAIAKEVVAIQRKERYRNPDFFRIWSFADDPGLRRFNMDAILLIPLEKKFHKRLTAFNHERELLDQTNSSTYIFIACYGIKSSKCPGYFYEALKNRPSKSYTILKQVYSHDVLTLYLAKME